MPPPPAEPQTGCRAREQSVGMRQMLNFCSPDIVSNSCHSALGPQQLCHELWNCSLEESQESGVASSCNHRLFATPAKAIRKGRLLPLPTNFIEAISAAPMTDDERSSKCRRF